MSHFQTHYDNLKVARDAPLVVIRAAYKVLAQKYHPDRNPGDPAAARVMVLVNEAYRVLSNAQSRSAHDEWIRQLESSSRQRQGRSGLSDANGRSRQESDTPHPPPASSPQPTAPNPSDWHPLDPEKFLELEEAWQKFMRFFGMASSARRK